MNVIIYNINSFGGNYEYARYLFHAYKNNPEVGECILLMPENAEIQTEGVKKILITDLPKSSNKWVKKFHFLYRSLVNPIRLSRFLKKQPSSVVLFNDFDQITAWFWAPLFHSLKQRHKFAVMLHDPDRDRFFGKKSLSESSMQQVMSFMDVAFYHGFLPEKKYYNGNYKKVAVPHGIYMYTDVDENVYSSLEKEKVGYNLIGILGNIRAEKNYDIVINALPEMEGVKLLVAGKTANSGVSLNSYKELADKLGVADRIIWMEGYLSQEAFNAAIKACDVVLLYYKPSFTSQSGVLNTIAPFCKKLIISDTKSSLRECVEQYGIGSVIPYDNTNKLATTVKNLVSKSDAEFYDYWQSYMKDSSWEKNVSIAVKQYKELY